MNPSQDEINEMSGDSSITEPSISELMGSSDVPALEGDTLTAEEIDTLGEVGNICMGAVATTMYSLLDRRVKITTPRVSVLTLNEALQRFPAQLVVVEVEYVEGIMGRNMLLLEELDAALITDILMGGEGVVNQPVELSDLHMSAINEIMNQLTGSSATALSQLINDMVRISPPVSRRATLSETNTMSLERDDLVIIITFDMEIEDLLNSQLIQVMPYAVGRDLSQVLTTTNTLLSAPPPATDLPDISDFYTPTPQAVMNFDKPAPSLDLPEPPHAPSKPSPEFAAAASSSYLQDSLNLIHDIPVQVSVELGRTKKEISEILDFDSGTVIVLDKTAGDPVEIYVNRKLVASGEVVVIDENYGVRITALYS